MRQPRVLVALLLIANFINLGADLGAMGDALRLLIGGPKWAYVILFAAVCAGLEIFSAAPERARRHRSP